MTAVEPGLLRILRGFVIVRLVLLTLTVWSVARAANPNELRYPGPGMFFTLLLFALLFIPAAERKLGRGFLPTVLTIASIGPIFEGAATIEHRFSRGVSANQAFGEYWLVFFLLFVPLLMIAWQYRYRAVLLFSVGTTVLDVVVLAPLLRGRDAATEVIAGLIFARGLLFAFVGFFVVKLVGAQREAHRALARHGATVEQLATSRERNRLARELHDTLAHSLSAVAVQLEAVRSLWDQDPGKAREMLDSSLAGARDGLRESRRAINELRAAPLEELGLGGALSQLVDAAQTRSGIDIAATIGSDLGEVDAATEQVTYRIADEALTNVTRHSQASSASLRLDRVGRRLELTVADDGRGFDADGAAPNGHLGIRGMRERAELIGGELSVDSHDGQGTVVRFTVETAA